MHSMTGFGRGEASLGSTTVTTEISSVNRKQAEVIVGLPKEFTEFDSVIRKAVLARISRGRINATINIDRNKKENENYRINLPHALAIEAEFMKLSQELGRDLDPLRACDFLHLPEFFLPRSTQQSDPELLPVILKSLEKALEALLLMREKEGMDLFDDLNKRVVTLAEILCSIEQLAPSVLQNYHTSLLAKMREFLTSAELPELTHDERLLKEVALYADKSDLSEELTRLHSHLARFQEYLTSSEPVGRSLDFLCQELNREFNTIGAKANHAEIAHFVVQGKTEIEKIREQVQNIE